jgi:hypothetical protein
LGTVWHHASYGGVSLVPSVASRLSSFPLGALLVHESHRQLANVDGVIWTACILSIVVDDVEIILLQKRLLLLLRPVGLRTACRARWDRSEATSYLAITADTSGCSRWDHSALVLLPRPL